VPIIIEIKDSSVPLTLIGPADVRLECGDCVDAKCIGFPEILTSCGAVEFSFTDSELIGGCSANTGSFIRTYTAVDGSGNTAVVEQKIIIEDTVPPVFEGNIPDDLWLEDCGERQDTAQPIFTDNCDYEISVYFTEREITNGECVRNKTLERTWTAVDDCGNESSFLQTVHISCPLQVYNGISANNDGANDIFFLDGIECYPDNTVKIFNRWGVLVFETEGYNNGNRSFKGISEGRVTIEKNKKLPDGDYFYIVTYIITHGNGQSEVKKETGNLYLNN
tara:strand:- start:5054 stop:5887 length:834 start_codon:yes stop_codon:yes gene_type:complete